MPYGEGLTIKERVLYAFSQPPASFAFDPYDWRKAVANGQATLRITGEHSATLVCVGSRDEAANKRNAWLLCFFLAVTGWEEGSEDWMTRQLQAAARSRQRHIKRTVEQRNVKYELLIEAGFFTLTATARGPVGGT